MDLEPIYDLLNEYGGGIDKGKEIDDLSKSLNTLVKYNGGKWKSEKQARFLLKMIRDYRSPEAKQWAQQYKPEGHWSAIALVQHLKGYGYKDPTKIRYSAQFFLVDETGVKARAKAKVEHPKGEKGSMNILATGAKETFVRPEGGDDKIINIAKERAEKAQNIEAQKKKNEPIINRIKAIPGWENKEILASFVTQLEKGYTLSYKQLAVIDTMDPPKVTVDALQGIDERWKELTTHIEKSFLPVFRDLSKKYWGGTGGGVDKHFKAVLDGEHMNTYNFSSFFGDTLERLKLYTVAHQFLPYAGGSILTAYRDEVEKARKKAKTKKPLAKKTAKAMTGLALLHDKLLKVSETQLRSMWKKELEDKSEATAIAYDLRALLSTT